MALPVGFVQPEFHGGDEDHEDFVDSANAAAITGAVAFFPNVPLELSGAQIIPARNVAKDWTIAGGCPTNAIPVAPNAGGGVPIILAGVRSGQKLHWIRKHYPTANKYVKMLEIGALKQSTYESIPSFWAKIQKYVATVGNFQPPPKIYPIKSEKPQQAFYIVDQEGNYMDPLTQDPNYHKYLEQTKAMFKKPQQQNQFARIDGLESVVEKVADSVDQLTNQFGKMTLDNQPKKPFYCSNCGQEGHRKNYCPELISQQEPIAKSNFTYRYFPSLKPVQFQQSWQSQNISLDSDDNENDEVDKSLKKGKFLENKAMISCKSLVLESKQNEKVASQKLFPESDDQLLQLLSLAIQEKIMPQRDTSKGPNLSTKNKWIESLEYMQSKIEDIIIPEAIADNALECIVMNKALNKTLEWDLGIAPDFFLIDVPISVKHKNEWVTVTGNIVVIDNGETNYLLCLEMPWIRKVQGILDLNKHEIRIAVRGKSYIIPIFTKAIEDNVSSNFYTTAIQDNDSKNQTFDSSSKTNTKEKPVSNKEKELEFHSKIQIISGIKNLENRATIKKEFIRALDYAEYLEKELI
ncbi:39657_t:CDS:2 [Gigaspora margarita]|uniref:39657_t:CDS:1 n=1 Tax=Gigaspora margarita TaxID=4874 RepID=A0ABN7VQQ8_GIGMA|nr:39657_t:CDS:2 [Gigaspora margarita]